YFKRDYLTAKGGFSKSALIFIFPEEEDQIYYRYMSYIDSYFTKSVKTILTFEENKTEEEVIHDEIVKLHMILCNLTDYLSSKSEYVPEKLEQSRKFVQINQTEKKKFKVVVLGDPKVGKTSTILRFTDNIFFRAYIPTMGLNITQKIFDIDTSIVELVLWDIGGQTKFELIRKKFYEGASIIKKRIVNKVDAKNLAFALDLEYLEISALTGDNVETTFQNIAQKLLSFNKMEE
ncbi:MAG: ADP-ribosylation factor-like protein, partial [Promethearchaeota archaeon]